MEKIKNLYYQIDNQKYLKEKLGRELWIQVSGHCILNSANACFWAAFVPLENSENIFSDTRCDSIINTQKPGFFQKDEEIVYERINKSFSVCENIVHYRDFFGIKPNYVEIVEEFRLLNNLYHDMKTNIYYDISENGESIEVAKIENDVCAFIKLEYLMRYASARRMALSIFFDIRTSFIGNLIDNGVSKFSDCYKYNNLFYEIYGYEDGIDGEHVYSVLRGKRVIYPKPIEECGYYPYEKKREYESFIIDIDEQGKPIKFSCNPDKLSDKFGKNSGAPNYLTLVFFKKEVLQKYLSHPNLYSVEDGYLRCKGLWGIAIDNHHMEYVSAYLGDLGRDLPAQEQGHWLQYNIATSEKLSMVKYRRDFLCIATNPDISDLKFKDDFNNLCNKWKEKFGWDLFLPLCESDEYNVKLLHIPITESQEEFDHQVLSLVKTIIDSLNEKAICEQIKDKSNLQGSISKLERWFSELSISEFEPHIKFLRNLQKLRSTGTGHRKGKDYEKIKNEFGLSDDNFKVVFNNILINVNSFLSFLYKTFLK